MLMAPGWTSLADILDQVKARHRALVPSRLSVLVSMGLMERRVVARRVQWRRAAITWRSAVVGKLCFVWVDGGPLYVRLFASWDMDSEQSHRKAVARDRKRAGTYRTRGPQKNPRQAKAIAA